VEALRGDPWGHDDPGHLSHLSHLSTPVLVVHLWTRGARPHLDRVVCQEGGGRHGKGDSCQKMVDDHRRKGCDAAWEHPPCWLEVEQGHHYPANTADGSRCLVDGDW